MFIIIEAKSPFASMAFAKIRSFEHGVDTWNKEHPHAVKWTEIMKNMRTDSLAGTLHAETTGFNCLAKPRILMKWGHCLLTYMITFEDKSVSEMVALLRMIPLVSFR